MHQFTKPGAVTNLGPIPFINFGEIKNVRSYRSALRQLAGRRTNGTSAIAVYDDQGNVHLQIFQPPPYKKPTPGVTPPPPPAAKIIFDKGIGRVATPRFPNGIPMIPGTAPFGNAIEPRILDLLRLVTGQAFRFKHSNAHGPDIMAREAAALPHG